MFLNFLDYNFSEKFILFLDLVYVYVCMYIYLYNINFYKKFFLGTYNVFINFFLCMLGDVCFILYKLNKRFYVCWFLILECCFCKFLVGSV